MKEKSYSLLKETALKNRIRVLDMIYKGKSGHIGGSLSAVDIITYLVDCVIDFNEKERERFILSKGNDVPALYA